MILVDFNQIMMATIHSQSKVGELDENLVRHIALNTLKHIRSNFKNQYGDLVICADHGYSWRRDYYEYYKHCRRENRKNSEKDWHSIFEILNKIRTEISETFHYPMIHVEKCEADDIIGVLTHLYGDTDEPILIYSGDKDFIQLQKFSNVAQYSQGQRKFLKTDDAEAYLKEHIIRGDGGDGIPNFLSDDDTFAAGGSQKRIYSSKVTQWLKMNPSEFTNKNTHYERNKKLIDLSEVPDDLKVKILEEYEIQKNKKDGDVMGYFTNNGLKKHLENAQDFISTKNINSENALF